MQQTVLKCMFACGCAEASDTSDTIDSTIVYMASRIPPVVCSVLINGPVFPSTPCRVDTQARYRRHDGYINGPRTTTNVKIKLMTSRCWDQRQGSRQKRKRASVYGREPIAKRITTNLVDDGKKRRPAKRRFSVARTLSAYCASYYRPLFPATLLARIPFPGAHNHRPCLLLLSNILPQQPRFRLLDKKLSDYRSFKPSHRDSPH